MFALSVKKSRVRPVGLPETEAGRVLPRPLRRIVRFLVSLAAGRIYIPRHSGSAAAALFLGATGLYGMSLGGHSQDVAQASTTAIGFAIEDVKVSGNRETSEIDILERLGLDGTTSLVALDVKEARQKLTELPWVEDASVRKVYPGTIEIALNEREAFAIWQHGTDLSLIEKNGSVIAPLRDNKFSSLPLFVGRDAETAAASFADEFDSWPELKSRVKAYIRVAGRRWDLRLDNGIVVKLPEHNVPRAMDMLASLDASEQLLERDIAAVDLRLEDRTTVQLTEGALERRNKAVEQRAKDLKKAAKRT
ncbi:cell division protein FtsQ/DivIB [Shinella sp. CPCC 101442]|uniref:cell division protein FtsQ/DivIB n=1 Tax=Shinella sp. CPCC 101442 TaxID=2932265 RepID=UPI0021537A1E|nr:cell division protein FtsQ/DivIB [Shinella sp. CPCC 101442]MCR6499940.1 cell division protein FtsQ/DivIB [Shinella sp. CPCC 101442]